MTATIVALVVCSASLFSPKPLPNAMRCGNVESATRSLSRAYFVLPIANMVARFTYATIDAIMNTSAMVTYALRVTAYAWRSAKKTNTFQLKLTRMSGTTQMRSVER